MHICYYVHVYISPSTLISENFRGGGRAPPTPPLNPPVFTTSSFVCVCVCGEKGGGIIFNKRPMGHIAHLRNNKVYMICTWTIMVFFDWQWKKIIFFFFRIGWSSFVKTCIPFAQGCFVAIETGPVVVEKKIFVFSLFLYHLPLGKTEHFIWTILNSL